LGIDLIEHVLWDVIISVPTAAADPISGVLDRQLTRFLCGNCLARV
jgi:hypothetical protein